MKKIILLVAIFFISACSSNAPSVRDSHGNTLTLNSYKGKWILINYWAAWCKPCINEMPALEKLYKNHKKQLVVIGVNYDSAPNKILNQFAQKYYITYPLTSQFPLQKIGVESIPVVPTTFIINPKGKLVKTLRGPHSEKKFLAELGIKDAQQSH